MAKHYVIIGSSAAGMGAINKLRDLDPTSRITCITKQTHLPYNRCLVADVLAGKKSAPDITLKGSASLAERGIDMRLGLTATEIDANNQRVLLSDGSNMAYDTLLLAAGRSPCIPTLPGSGLAGVLSFFGLSDVEAILAYTKANPVRQVIVVGAGLSGLECADALRHYDVAVTVVERADHVLPHQLNYDGSKYLINHANTHGIVMRMGRTIAAIEGDSEVKNVVLDDGDRLPADLVIFAIGGRTNSQLAHSASLRMLGNAVDVDAHQRTSDPHIFAAGDIATITDQVTGQRIQSCLWPDAVMQGMVAANNMLGTEKKYAGATIVTSSTIFNTTFVTAGPIATPPPGLRLLVKNTEQFYHAFLLDSANSLHGFALVGNIDNVGLLRKKLLDKSPLF